MKALFIALAFVLLEITLTKIYNRKKKYVCEFLDFNSDLLFIYNQNSKKMTKQILDTQAPFSVAFKNPVDAKGNPCKVSYAPGVSPWGCKDESIATVTVPDENDPLRAIGTLTGKLGTTQLICTVQDADGVSTITGVVEIEVVASNAATLGEPTFDLGEVAAAPGTEAAVTAPAAVADVSAAPAAEAPAVEAAATNDHGM